MQSMELLEDRFELGELTGSGGMGEVYRALDRNTGQTVAVKVLRGKAAAETARFERESRILSAITNPRIVRYVAHGIAQNGNSYLAMEWLDGEDLARRLSRGPLSPSEAVNLCVEIAEALGHLHAQGIVHRDLKPSNVFLIQGSTTEIRLLDLGIAQVEASVRMTGTGTLVGTFGYMAPEQANDTKNIDSRADVFALGCVLFECLAGTPAFAGTHPMAILTKILFEESPRLNDRGVHVSAQLDMLLSRLLSKDRENRLPDGFAVAAALRECGDMQERSIADTATSSVPIALTDSEQRALAFILVSAPANASQSDEAAIDTAAREHGATIQRLLDGSLALLLSSTGVVTDLAAQGARCALAVRASAMGRRVVLAMARGHGVGTLPVGPAIDQAARLLGSETSDSALVSIDDASVGLLDARFDVHDESGIYVLSGERDVAEVRTLLGKATPCVGREREMRMLEGLFDDGIGDEPRAQAVLVTAPPGVGKSRFGREFLQKVRMRDQPITLWLARGEPLRAGSAFGVASQLVESAVGIRGGEALARRREKLRARVVERVAESRQGHVTNFLGEMIGAPFSDNQSPALLAARSDAQLMNDQIRAAFIEFLSAECAAAPLLLFVEDLHCGDASTIEMLGRALAELKEKPLFILALSRPELHDIFPKLWAGREVQEIGMNELPKKASERLVRHVLGDRIDAATVQKIVELAAGNAFYLEELIRATAEGRGDDLPETVVAMVQSRLGALSDGERRILRAASIFGETFWSGALSALLGGAKDAASKLEARLRALVDKELFARRTESHFPNETEYAFRHALLREGAYAMLTEEDRTLGHRLAAEWLEVSGEDDPVMLAEHFEKGNEGAKAGELWARAAERAFRGNESARGLSYVHRGLACPVRMPIRLRLLGELCHLHYLRIETLAVARPYAEELISASEPGSATWARAMLVLLVLSADSGNAEVVARAMNQTIEAEILDDGVDAAALLFAAASYLLAFAGNTSQANDLFLKLGALARRDIERTQGAKVIYHVVGAMRSAASLRDPWSGLCHARSANHTATLIGHRRHVLSALRCEAMNWWLLGAHEESKAILKSLHGADSYGLNSSVRLFVFAWLCADSNVLDEALVHATELVTSGKKLAVPRDEARGHWVLAEVLRRLRQFERAEVEIDIALCMLRDVCPVDVPGALATLSALRLDQGQPAQAFAYAEEGMAKMLTMWASSYFFRDAFLCLVHAESAWSCDRRDEAKRVIERAKQWLLVAAEKIGEDQYKNTFLRNVPENRRILELAERWSA